MCAKAHSSCMVSLSKLLALGRQNKLQGISDQIKYTLRDETNHIAFGTYVINTIIEQNPSIWTKKDTR